MVLKSANNSDAPGGNRTHVDRLETCNSTTKLLALIRGVGFEPTRISPLDLKTNSLNLSDILVLIQGRRPYFVFRIKSLCIVSLRPEV